MEDLPPGFRFYPTEEELVSFYLQNKLEGKSDNLNRVMGRVIPVLDIYDHNPWELPRYSGELCHGDPEQWFFFIPRQESEARGGRPNRLTTTGYWKATGSPSCVYSSKINRAIGLKRTMVFYTGRAPQGKKTEWKMNEYKAIEGDHQAAALMQLRHEFSLCRVYKKSKCLRAFDRRPAGVEEISNRPPTIQLPPPAAPQAAYDQDHHHHHQDQDQDHLQAGCSTSTSHHDVINPIAHPMVMVERTMTSSPGSTSSGDDHHGPDNPSQPSTGEGGSSLPVALDNELAFWDCDWDEKLNWF